MKVSVIPFYPSLLNNKFFDITDKTQNRDNSYMPYFELKKYFDKQGFEINTVDLTPIKNADYIIFFDLNIKYLLQALYYGKLHKSIYMQFEPPLVDELHADKELTRISKLFSRVMTWNDDLIDNKNFFKFYVPMPKQDIVYQKVNFNDKKFLTMIAGYKMSIYTNELYSERIKAIRYFENHIPSKFDLYGIGWNKNSFPSYKGKVESKYEILKQYKYSICYENIYGMNGLLSEKIFDCFYARTIPIFWGAENVASYIPEKCYIDKRKFSTYDELIEHLQSISEEEYEDRISAIELFLQSDEYKKYLPEAFAKNIFESTIKPNKMVITGGLSNIIWLFYKKINQKIRRKIHKIIALMKIARIR